MVRIDAELAGVVDALAEVPPRDLAPAWMSAPHRLLDGCTPTDLVQAGEHQRVRALIDAMAEGVAT